MIHTGTIMDITGGRTYVFTKACDMVSIKTKTDYILGQQITFSDKDKFSLNNILRISNYRMLSAIAAVFLIIVAAVVFTVLRPQPPAFDTNCVAVVSIDINPSVEISVNKDNRIIDVRYSNSTGKELSDALDLRNMTVEEGVAQLVALARQKGYLDENKLILVSAALYAPSGEPAGEYAQQLRAILTSIENSGDDAEILTIFIDDSDIIGKAEQSDISIGKQLLYQYAVEHGIPISLQEIKDGTISDILDRLKVDGQNGSLVPKTDTADAAASSSPAAFSADVRVTAADNGLTVQWNKAPQNEGFLSYKVVASAANSSPAYPGDGYALDIAAQDTTSAFLESGCAYYGGDAGGALVGGQSYYISVSYVYQESVVKGNAVKITMPLIPPSPAPSEEPEESAAPDRFDPRLSVTVLDGKLKFSWTPLDSASVVWNGTTYEGFQHYKVVASPTDPTPVYPDNGYIHDGTKLGTSSWTVDPSGDSYHQSPKLESGKKYYFSVTYVFDNGKFVTNTVSTTIPAYLEEPEETGTDFSTPQLSVSVSGDTMYFNWTALPIDSVSFGGTVYSGFRFYKVVASETDSTPIYPDDGYLYAASNLGTSSWSVSPARGNYNKSPVLESGRTYYFTVTYVFDNGKFVTESATATVPEYSENAVDFASPALFVSADAGLLNFTWTPLPNASVKYNGTTYTNFQHYKVVASETDSTPVYPDNGHLYSASGLETASWSVDPAGTDYTMSPALEPGKTYYFSITYVFANGKFVSNTATATIPVIVSEPESPAPDFSSPALSVSSVGSVLNFSWTQLPADEVSCNGTTYSDFQHYKVVASQTNPNPVYPDDGYLYAEGNIGVSSWSVDTAGGGSGLVPGQTYYFSITYVFGSGKFVTNTVQYTVP